VLGDQVFHLLGRDPDLLGEILDLIIVAGFAGRIPADAA